MILITLSFSFASIASAQAPLQSAKRNSAIILFSSLGGAILGLSTLSFYGDPENHTNNITTGALLGLAVGAGYVVSNSKSEAAAIENDFAELKKKSGFKPAPIVLSFNFDF
ncbi:MAG: hypothetical protein ACLGGX_00795 [Bdellovibrionia bacterium]